MLHQEHLNQMMENCALGEGGGGQVGNSITKAGASGGAAAEVPRPSNGGAAFAHTAGTAAPSQSSASSNMRICGKVVKSNENESSQPDATEEFSPGDVGKSATSTEQKAANQAEEAAKLDNVGSNRNNSSSYADNEVNKDDAAASKCVNTAGKDYDESNNSDDKTSYGTSTASNGDAGACYDGNEAGDDSGSNSDNATGYGGNAANNGNNAASHADNTVSDVANEATNYAIRAVELPPRPPPRGQPQPAPVKVVPKTRSEREKRYRLISRQLATLIHARECESDENALNAGALWNCTVPYCREMKHVLDHLIECQNSTNCRERFCLSSRQMICHWKNCRKPSCRVCLPLPLPGPCRDLERIFSANRRPFQEGYY
ncbi:sericin-2-like isoform X2 [Battus philenor]|uniref:sericin-2-like isoform X2 n=1 Tax=Battus philenor TaxID=42288 RepID=UPI0035CEC7D0